MDLVFSIPYYQILTSQAFELTKYLVYCTKKTTFYYAFETLINRFHKNKIEPNPKNVQLQWSLQKNEVFL